MARRPFTVRIEGLVGARPADAPGTSGSFSALFGSEATGTCEGWINSDFNNDDKRAVYYIKKTGDGEVLWEFSTGTGTVAATTSPEPHG